MAATAIALFSFHHLLYVPISFLSFLMCGFASLVAQQAPWQLKFVLLDRLLWWTVTKPWFQKTFIAREGKMI